MDDYRVAHVSAEGGDPRVTESGHRMENSEEYIPLGVPARKCPPDIHINKVSPYAFDEEGDEEDVQDHFEQPADTILVQHIFQHQFAGERRVSHKGEGEETGEGHYPDPAYLYQDHNDDMSYMCEGGCHIDRGKPGYADRRRGGEQGVHEMDRAGRRVREHQ